MLMKDPKKMVSLIIGAKKPSEMMETPQSEEGGDYDDSIGMEAAADEILKAVESKSSKALVEALKAFWEMCEEQPHEEGPHISEE